MSPAAQRWLCLAGMFVVISFGSARREPGIPDENIPGVIRISIMGVLCGWTLCTHQIKEAK